MSKEFIVMSIIEKMTKWMEPHGESGHGGAHCLQVWLHAKNAIKAEPILTENQKFAIELAALLHEVDDRKFFKKSSDFQNARAMLREAEVDGETEKLIIFMISRVSCSKNRTDTISYPDSLFEETLPKWINIPMDCDRLEAIGENGIVRCHQYAKSIGNPVFLADTPRVNTIEELRKVATKERFDQYVSSGKSRSVIDHFYDKLLHISDMKSENSYLVEEATKRQKIMEDYVLEFGKTGIARLSI